ncbi:putative acyl-CoA synthetase short-chain family member 3 mitochondrial [Scophthalmus maximus]|uniref:Acyl-CoA synthetase short-chain family member 3, mitochondrial n=1 Tax=Scophthalmus maximus TaxID=52904 RepID=A0A2U9B2P9_SCOMX|nr:putative acyl-CoA synthetase short-chain family member 3 mitochondrial [Scophthalmus maximus]
MHSLVRHALRLHPHPRAVGGTLVKNVCGAAHLPGTRGAPRRCRGHASAAADAAADGAYVRAFAAARDQPDRFWAEVGRDVDWFEPWSATLRAEDPVFPNWFVGGKLNMCHNAVDRHVESGRGEQPAIIYDSPVTGTKQIITFRELQDQVSRLAGVLVKNGVRKGDLVVIYMPMVPQAMFTMLACARIGAPHSLIFGGFAPKELSVRIDHAKPKLMVTSSFGIEPGRRVDYIPLVERALELSSHRPSKVLIYNRPNMEHVSVSPELNLDWEEEMATARPHDCVSLPSNHPLYVLYTSGTTGTPKGVVRDTAGYAAMLKWTMSNIYGLSPGDVWWAASDLGWVVGHSYICYGPLLHGNSTILYEGKPVGTPDPGAFFRVLSEHGAASMFTAPTAIRAIRQQDPGAELGKKFPLTRLRSLFLAGERCDVETLEWAKRSFGVPILDHWWQTEESLSTCVRLPSGLPIDGPSPSGLIRTVAHRRLRRALSKKRRLHISKTPLPPGAALSLWQNQNLFRELYFTKFPGYYDTMDAGFVNEEGFLYIMSRSDDVINVAGHRLSAGALEEAVLQHPAVGDCAVVGLDDTLKGHVPLALCVLQKGVQRNEEEIISEMVKLVRENIGPVAAFRRVLFVRGLPKTRSGKIPRSSLANLVNGKPYKITPTIEDPGVFADIERQVEKALRPRGA